MRHATGRGARLAGLDLARYLALAGMVFVNFKQAMHPALQEPGTQLGEIVLAGAVHQRILVDPADSSSVGAE